MSIHVSFQLLRKTRPTRAERDALETHVLKWLERPWALDDYDIAVATRKQPRDVVAQGALEIEPDEWDAIMAALVELMGIVPGAQLHVEDDEDRLKAEPRAANFAGQDVELLPFDEGFKFIVDDDSDDEEELRPLTPAERKQLDSQVVRSKHEVTGLHVTEGFFTLPIRAGDVSVAMDSSEFGTGFVLRFRGSPFGPSIRPTRATIRDTSGATYGMNTIRASTEASAAGATPMIVGHRKKWVLTKIDRIEVSFQSETVEGVLALEIREKKDPKERKWV